MIAKRTPRVSINRPAIKKPVRDIFRPTMGPRNQLPRPAQRPGRQITPGIIKKIIGNGGGTPFGGRVFTDPRRRPSRGPGYVSPQIGNMIPMPGSLGGGFEGGEVSPDGEGYGDMDPYGGGPVSPNFEGPGGYGGNAPDLGPPQHPNFPGFQPQRAPWEGTLNQGALDAMGGRGGRTIDPNVLALLQRMLGMRGQPGGRRSPFGVE